MILSLPFFISSWILGLAVLEVFQIILLTSIRNIFGLVIGFIINTLLIFFLSLFSGLTITVVITILFLTFIPSLLYLIKRATLPTIIEFLPNFKKNKHVYFGLTLISLIIVLIFSKSIFVDSSGIVAGNRLVWIDWPVHIALISSFVYGNNFPPQNPLYSGPVLTYPFFSDFFSSILQVLGANLKFSLAAPGIIFGILSVLLIFYFGLLVTGKKNIALLGTFVGIFWGGLGFLYLIQDVINSSSPINTLLFPPHEYTFYAEKNLWFFSFIYSELLPQRGFLFGLPMFFTSLMLLIFALNRNKKNYFILSAIVAGLMPFFHLHSLISLVIFDVSFITVTLINSFLEKGPEFAKKYLTNIGIYFVLPFILITSIQLPFFLSTNITQSIGFNFGWMKNQENLFLFWFKNTGLFLPLFLITIFAVKTNKIAKHISIAAVPLFIIPNILRFAAWPYDNLKIFTYWYFISAFFVAIALERIYQKNTYGKILAALLTVTLTLSGLIEVTRILNVGKNQIPLWTKKDSNLAQVIIEKTEPQSIILTAAVHDHPVSALSGRKLIIGFPGNAWTWGFSDWQQRESDVRIALKGDPVNTPNILKKYSVDYVLISGRERNFEPQTNENYFTENLTFIAGGEDYKLYKVR